MKVGIGRAAIELGVSRDTLRRWEAAGKIEVERTASGHRRYDLTRLRRLASAAASGPVTVAYAKVANSKQKQQLTEQIVTLEKFCLRQGWRVEIIQDSETSGNYHKSGLKQLIKRIAQGDVERLVLTRRDRLAGSELELVFSLCEYFRTEVLILNAHASEACQHEVVEKVVEIISHCLEQPCDENRDANRDIIRKLSEIFKTLKS